MKVLLTGAAGQLGRALTATAPDGIALEACDRKNCDLTDPVGLSTMLAWTKPDVVINAGAYTKVDLAESEQGLARTINADAVRSIVRVLADTGGRLVHVSTDYVFDGESGRAYRPGDARRPINVYGETKAAGEDHLREEDLLVRTSWLYAPGHGNFVTTMLRLMAEREDMAVVADQIAAPTLAHGLARTIWALLDTGAQGCFHHSDAGVASWYDFAVAIEEEARAAGLLERPVAIRPVASADFPTIAKRPAFSLLDSSATRELLGDGAVHWRTNLRRALQQEAALG